VHGARVHAGMGSLATTRYNLHVMILVPVLVLVLALVLVLSLCCMCRGHTTV